MAKIGLNNFRYSKLTESETGTATYAGAKKPARAVSCKVSVSTSSASLYADDALAESDSSFNSGTVTIGIDEEDNATVTHTRATNRPNYNMEAGKEADFSEYAKQKNKNNNNNNDNKEK